MNKTSISDDLLQKYTASARAFVKETRGWEPDEYKLSFRFLVEEEHVAVFHAIHMTGLYEINQQVKDGTIKMGSHPLEFGILIDTNDLKVYENNENSPWAKKK